MALVSELKSVCLTRPNTRVANVVRVPTSRIAKVQKRSAPVSHATFTADPTTQQSSLAGNVAAQKDLNARHRDILKHFPSALGVDDFIARCEVVLSGYGFTGDNSIAMTNLCRDEITLVLKDKIEAVFGSSFNTNGLGGVLTCGVTGMGAGLSHSPTSSSGRERYVFFSFPHIAIDSASSVGTITRPGRSGRSCACGALLKALGELKAEGYACNCKVPGVHDPLDPEYSILKQRLARRLRYEKTDVSKLDLVGITAVAERTITNDLEYLIEKAVDLNKADYAVVTGVQIHNWATSLEADGTPSLEFVAPTKVFVVVNGVKIHLDLTKVPSLAPRQLLIMAAGSAAAAETHDANFAISHSTGSTLQEIPYSYLNKRLGGATVLSPDVDSLVPPSAGLNPISSWPAWQSVVRLDLDEASEVGAPTMESPEEEVHTSFDLAAASASAVTPAAAAAVEAAAAASPVPEPAAAASSEPAAAAAPEAASEETPKEEAKKGWWFW
uniref:Limiting CO2-inducible protein B/C beta carbonyic anhydrase domain-containing protein n=1 Tax=Chlamydomonas chlamydogama TaxID=225041 RepID=A0A7S2VV11_9CHLO|mmetsp:Transcript_1485/g.3266  ORF Transcript_1485/g.3266 Transcript_1485/m.3266 type:complete len:498 (+) Transcript_1485:148-1641(+)